MLIRPGTLHDASSIMDIHKSAILEIGPISYSDDACKSWASGLSEGQYTDAMTTGGESYIVAEQQKRPVGFISYKQNEVIGLYVHPSYARRGCGGMLLSAAEKAIKKTEATEIKLNAALSARLFYLSRGYREIGRRLWRTRSGIEIEICEMQKSVVFTAN